MTDDADPDDTLDAIRFGTVDITWELGSGDEKQTVGFEDVEFRSVADARAETQERRENAPEPEYLTDERTAAIDDVIDALERAKARGIDRVYVNDDGQTFAPRPRVTNNHYEASPLAPPPGDLEEWVEL